MVRQLVPLHEPSGDPYRLPREGIVTIGRRLENNIICRDISVSGKHCQLKVSPSLLEVIDCSSNGTFVNDKKLVKGQPHTLEDGDLVQLMKPLVPASGGPMMSPPVTRIQYKVEVRPGDSPPDACSEAGDLHFDVPPSIPATSLQRGTTGTADGFAHDLLVQEQQSKAKITGELLLARRRLDEERVRSEGLLKEVRKAQTGLEEERLRLSTAQEVRDRLSGEAVQLRADRRQLQELRSSHETLIDQQDSAEVELNAHLQRLSSLEAAQERKRGELERCKGDASQKAQQLEETQQKLERAQASADRHEQAHSESRQAVEAAQQEVDRLQRDLGTERSAREQLDDQLQLLRAEADRAQQSEQATQEQLEATLAQRRELEARILRSRGAAEAARTCAVDAQGKHEAELARIESLRTVAGRLTDGLRLFTDRWARSVFEENSDAFHQPQGPAPALTSAFEGAMQDLEEAGGTQHTPVSPCDSQETVRTAAADDAADEEEVPEKGQEAGFQAEQGWSIEVGDTGCSPLRVTADAAATVAGASPGSALGQQSLEREPTLSPSPEKRRRLHINGH